MIPYIKGERKNNNNNKKKKRKENSLPRRRRWGDIMRRLGFERVVNVKEEEEEGEEGGLVDGGGGGGGERDYFSRVTSMVAPRPRRSFHRSSTGLSSALSFVSARRSYSYDKLGQVPIQLTVVKLDGSSFEIDVRNMATIADLKLAVERAFSHMPTKGPSKISWRHVWGHFCLSYHGQKLLHDDDFINTYGIKEGDQLRFVRHVSIAYNLIKKRSRKLIDAPKPQTIPDNFEEKCQKLEEGNDDLENLRQYQYEVEDNSTQNYCLRSYSFRGWFTYSRLSSQQNVGSEEDAGPSRWAGGFVGCCRSLFHFCDKRPPSYTSRVSQVEI